MSLFYKCNKKAGIKIGTLEETSWDVIQQVATNGEGSNYWSIGDTKSITLNGTIGSALTLSNYQCKVFILHFNYRNQNGIYFGFKGTNGNFIGFVDSGYGANYRAGQKYFTVNHYLNQNNYCNYGGWKGCDMRYDILGSTEKPPEGYNTAPTASSTTTKIGYDATPSAITNPVANTLMATLPSDLRNVLSPWTVYTDNVGGNNNSSASNVTASVDYLPLLSLYEVLGTTTGLNPTEASYQQRMSYFVNGNSALVYKHNALTTTCYAYTRSPAVSSNGRNWMLVKTNATGVNLYPYNSQGILPAFKVA